MKKFFYYSALLLFVLVISSCGKADSNSQSIPASASPSPSVSPSESPTEAPSAAPLASPSAAPAESPANLPSYLGEWTVRGIVGSSPISAGADESFIGTKAIYTLEKASFGDDEILKPEYVEQVITNADFVNEYRSQLSDIGIESESVTMVSINNWTNAGNGLMIKDDQTMIFLWDGNYYEMKKDK